MNNDTFDYSTSMDNGNGTMNNEKKKKMSRLKAESFRFCLFDVESFRQSLDLEMHRF